VRLLALAAAALALAGCETSAEKSARLERQAKLHEARVVQSDPLAALARGPAGRRVRVTATTLVQGREGTAVVVTVHNASASALAAVPILITIKGAGGQALYTNDLPGLSRSLTTIAALAPHSSLSWIDDQVQAAGTPASVTAKLGEGNASHGVGAAPLRVSGALSEGSENGGTVEGNVTNPSSQPHGEVVVYALARKGGRIVAAGRAVLPGLAAGSSAHFQLFLIGNPTGAQLQLSAT
jgi:hypothetical protein